MKMGAYANSCTRAPTLAVLVLLAGCAWPGTHTEPESGRRLQSVRRANTSHARSGVLRVLTYNVAGLPEMLSGSNPATNNLLASPLFNDYDLVLAQEDFAYHDELVHWARHAYRLTPMYPVETLFGDGLCALSVYPLEHDQRVRWVACSGYFSDDSDCFGEKGFSRASALLGSGVSVQVYNLHADAGASDEDVKARRRGFRQLASFIERNSAVDAMIVAGDTNLAIENDPRDRATLEEFAKETGVLDACAATRCLRPEVDRILYRGSAKLSLRATRYFEDHRFVDAEGRSLSDHNAVAVEFEWTRLDR